jgi:tRNA G26 N,N-dimethylase Trm1
LSDIIDERYVDSALQVLQGRRFRGFSRIHRMLSLIRKEAGGPPTYYVIDKVSDLLNLPVPPMKAVTETVQNHGFDAWPTHFHTRGLRSTMCAVSLQKVVSELAEASKS